MKKACVKTLSTTWLLAYRYPHMGTAGEAYQRARDIVFSEDIDASTFRVKLNGIPHVVVLGDGPMPPDLRRRFGIACEGGEAFGGGPPFSAIEW